MSRLGVWLCLGGTSGVMHAFGLASLDAVGGAIWFGGMGLLMHWWLGPKENA